jgi:hypothetical protein
MSRCAKREVEQIHMYPDMLYTRSSYHHYIFFRVYNTSPELFRLVHMPNGNYHCSLLTGEPFDFLGEIWSEKGERERERERERE